MGAGITITTRFSGNGERNVSVKIGRSGLAGMAVAVMILSGCASTESREAAPVAAADTESESALPTESSEPSEEASSDISTEPVENPEGERVQGLYRSTQVCFQNEDEIGLWRNYVAWEKFDTKDDRNPAFGEKVCAEGTFVTGADVKGSLHLMTRDRSGEIVVKFSGTNFFDSDPEIQLDGPGVSSTDSYYENESKTFWTQAPGSPRRVLEVKRLPDTKWIEFQITARSARTCNPGGECAVGDTGPGGGIVVYDAGSQQEWGQYLEVAPVGWAGSQNDPQTIWCPTSSNKYGTDLGTARDLGKGKANSTAIIEACGAETAAGIAAAYRGGGKSDWFLPSMNELNKVWQDRSSNPAFLQGGVNYWTSSQAETDIPAALKMAIELSNADWNPNEGPFFRAQMTSQRHVRPMRAF